MGLWVLREEERFWGPAMGDGGKKKREKFDCVW
jgi:hypothetical protein